MKVMLDTNVLISIILFPNKTTHKFLKKLCHNNDLLLCDYVIEELKNVINRKFPNKINSLEVFLDDLSFTFVHTPNIESNKYKGLMRDNNDIPILITTLKENVDVFVTGDKDFLVLNIDKPKIVTMSEYIQKY